MRRCSGGIGARSLVAACNVACGAGAGAGIVAGAVRCGAVFAAVAPDCGG